MSRSATVRCAASMRRRGIAAGSRSAARIFLACKLLVAPNRFASSSVAGPKLRSATLNIAARNSMSSCDGDDMFGFDGPEAAKIPFLFGDSSFVAEPGEENVQAFPIPIPAGLSFIETAVEGEPISSLVFNDASLFVEDAFGGNRPPQFVARHGDFHIKDLVRHHPCEQFEGFDFAMAAGFQRIREQMRL